MQRELRFRMWSNEKCFKYIDKILIESDGCYISTDRLKILQCGTLCDSHHEDVIIEQYIGISDEDGTPIYENDTVSCDFKQEDITGLTWKLASITGNIIFINNRWQLNWQYGTTNTYYDLNILTNFKIIGNIHTE